MTHTETQAMCERLRESAVRTQAAQQWMADAKSERNRAAGDEGASYSGGTKEMTLEWQAAALLTRQQETIDRLREAAKGSAVVVNTAKAEIDQRDLLLGEAKSILSLLVSDKTTSTSSQSIWAQCVSLECRIRAALQAKP